MQVAPTLEDFGIFGFWNFEGLENFEGLGNFGNYKVCEFSEILKFPAYFSTSSMHLAISLGFGLSIAK